MSDLKRYLSYIILLVGFALLTNALIKVGLTGSYEKISRKSDSLKSVVVYQAEATKLNGRLRGIVNNDNKNIDTKYLKIEFYSNNDQNMGSSYVEIDKNRTETPFEVFFELNDVKSYKVSLVNEKINDTKEIEWIPKEVKKPEVILGTVVVALMFM